MVVLRFMPMEESQIVPSIKLELFIELISNFSGCTPRQLSGPIVCVDLDSPCGMLLPAVAIAPLLVITRY